MSRAEKLPILTLFGYVRTYVLYLFCKFRFKIVGYGKSKWYYGSHVGTVGRPMMQAGVVVKHSDRERAKRPFATLSVLSLLSLAQTNSIRKPTTYYVPCSIRFRLSGLFYLYTYSTPRIHGRRVTLAQFCA